LEEVIMVRLRYLLVLLSLAASAAETRADEKPDRRADADRLLRLHKALRAWLARDLPPDQLARNQDYADLTVAFGLARLGQAEASRALLRPAAERLGKLDEVHRCLAQAFVYRTEQALAGRPHTGPLPAEVFKPLDTPEKPTSAKLQRYMVNRMREYSRILEPQERVDPYASWTTRDDRLLTELTELQEVRDRAALEKRIRQMLDAAEKERRDLKTRLTVLAGVLPLAPRVSEPFTAELLGRVAPLLKEQQDAGGAAVLMRQPALLEESLALAGDINRADLAKDLAARAAGWLASRQKERQLDLAGGLPDQALSTLRKLGLRDEARRLLTGLTPLLPRGKELDALRSSYERRWPAALQSLLQLASGWLALGESSEATPVLDEARALLFPGRDVPAEGRLLPVEYTRLASSYAAAVGQFPPAERLERLEELFTRMEKIPDRLTTQTHYSRLHLMIAEVAVLAVARPD
jgi:hypothetical protein